MYQDSLINILPSILFAFWKLVFHSEEHHQSNSRITPKYLLLRIFGHLIAQLWLMQVTRKKLSSCDTDSLAVTSSASVTGKSMSWLFIPRLKEIHNVALKVDLMLCWCVISSPFPELISLAINLPPDPKYWSPPGVPLHHLCGGFKPLPSNQSELASSEAFPVPVCHLTSDFVMPV